MMFTYIPDALGDEQRGYQDGDEGHGRHQSERSPIRYEVGHPGHAYCPECVKQAERDVGDERAPARAHVFQDQYVSEHEGAVEGHADDEPAQAELPERVDVYGGEAADKSQQIGHDNGWDPSVFVAQPPEYQTSEDGAAEKYTLRECHFVRVVANLENYVDIIIIP